VYPVFGNSLSFLVSPPTSCLTLFLLCLLVSTGTVPMTARMNTKEEAYTKVTKGEARAPAESTAVRFIGYQSHKGYANTELKGVKTIKNEKMKRRALWIRYANTYREAVRLMASLRGWLMLWRHSSPHGNPWILPAGLLLLLLQVLVVGHLLLLVGHVSRMHASGSWHV